MVGCALFRGLMLVCLIASPVVARTLVHTTSSHKAPQASRIKDVSTHMHVNAKLVDATERVLELPEQTLANPHSRKSLPDLEEDDERDPVRHIQEIPEQTLESADSSDSAADQINGKIPIDLEANSKRRRQSTPGIQVDSPFVKSVDSSVFDDDRSPQNFNGVVSETPSTGEPITKSGMWPFQSLAAHLPENFKNPLLKNRNQRAREASAAFGNVDYDSSQHKDEAIQLSSGGLQISIHNNHAKNFLDANRVQVGTSLLGAHDDSESEGRVARFRVRFINPFQKRPIILVTTVPEGTLKQNDVGPHPDVFAASVSEIRLDHFIVNVVRVDSFPNNGWGQKLYLDWIAMEYDSEYPTATNFGAYLPTHPDFQDLEKTVVTAPSKSAVLDEASDWDN